jgi:hypothetical protein
MISGRIDIFSVLCIHVSRKKYLLPNAFQNWNKQKSRQASFIGLYIHHWLKN